MINGDPFDNGTPKYSSAADIYDALREMSGGEEIGILAEMFSDISWEGQDYYYTDNGYKLVERWDEMTDYGDKMWPMDISIWQMSDGFVDANEWVYEILCNDDLAKRIGFKKLFVDNVLGGMNNQYKAATEAFEEELRELNRFDFYANSKALESVLTSIGWRIAANPYGKLCSAVYNKLKGLRLDAEKQLVAESRAMLIGYDDFMFGLKLNQTLYVEQERMYQNKVALLQEKYEAAKRLLLTMAQEQGVVLQLQGTTLLLSATDERKE